MDDLVVSLEGGLGVCEGVKGRNEMRNEKRRSEEQRGAEMH
jgi:hypothetical protein